MEADSAVPAIDPPRYARLRRRIEAIAIDGMVFTVLFIGLITLFSALDVTAQAARFAALLALVLYEPILVTWTGGTVGHRYRNLRVVDDHTGGNISIFKSLLRFVIKIVLGMPSLITMFLTRRHQAIQDVLTGSTVQVRDINKARLASGHAERALDTTATMPSLVRRMLVIAAYGVLVLASSVGASLALVSSGMVSAACMYRDACTPVELGLTTGLGLIMLLLLVAFCLVQGLRGQL